MWKPPSTPMLVNRGKKWRRAPAAVITTKRGREGRLDWNEGGGGVVKRGLVARGGEDGCSRDGCTNPLPHRTAVQK